MWEKVTETRQSSPHRRRVSGGGRGLYLESCSNNRRMDSRELTSNTSTVTDNSDSNPISLTRAVLIAAVSFSLVSLIIFSSVAFAEPWMYRNLGVTGAYLTWIVLFIVLGASAFIPLLARPRKLLRFYVLFGVGFFLYGVGWMAAYFSLKNTVGEWLGSLVGSVLMAVVFAAGFKALRSAALFSFMLFAGNSFGYFLGSALYERLTAPAGMLIWGAVYGAGVGAALGAILWISQSRKTATT